MFVISLAFAIAMMGCSKSQQQIARSETPAQAPTPYNDANLVPVFTDAEIKEMAEKKWTPPKASEYKGHWKSLGISGSDFYGPTGEPLGGEGGLVIFRLKNGQVWQADFELPRDYRPIKKRWVYLSHLSSDANKGCGTEIGRFSSVPQGCLVEEKVITFNDVKRFLSPKLNEGRAVFRQLEEFYKARDERYGRDLSE